MQFKDVVGQSELKSHLIREVNSDKISHAQLFLGKPGYGTLPLALAFVQYLFCEQRNENDSCGVCNSCRKVSTHQHPDLHFNFPIVLGIDKTADAFIDQWRKQVEEEPYFDLNDWVSRIDPKERKPVIGNEQSHEIIKKLTLKSFEGGYKVMLIWMAEEMNATCSNKLLKILEEPPQKTLFILIGESQDKMLPTIISRTQLVKVPRINSDDIALYLRNKKDVGPSTTESVVGRCDGDLLEAMRILEAGNDQKANQELFMRLMRVCYKKSVIDMMDWAEEASAITRERQRQFILYALHMIRQSMLKNYTEDQLTRVSKEEDDFLGKFAPFISGNNVFDFSKSFNEAHYHLERNANTKLLFTVLCFNVMRYIHKA